MRAGIASAQSPPKIELKQVFPNLQTVWFALKGRGVPDCGFSQKRGEL
jgi:hypothetical protein